MKQFRTQPNNLPFGTMFLCATFSLILLATSSAPVTAQSEAKFDRQAQLRGSITPQRDWWDVQHYHLSVEVFPEDKQIRGSNVIRFITLKPGQRMQVDLQQPLVITKILCDRQPVNFEREGNVYWVDFSRPIPAGVEQSIHIFYEGTPVESKRPPWSGGISWNTDEQGNPFIATSCQGIGASIWWPNKDHGYDEPDRGMQIDITVPDHLTGVSNGRLIKTVRHPQQKTKTFSWRVINPINNYCVNMNIGKYVRFSETIEGEAGSLDMDYWALVYQRDKAVQQFKEAPRTIEAFEYWFGQYPFYEDSYKLVVVPYLGMEHQSSVTYGNGFQNGYNGTDLSATGVGMKFDFIIVHETGHEWFGNNISMKDTADMWIHESFTNYSENLFVEYHFTKKEAEDYVIGCRGRILNDRPIIGTYNVNRSGSGDMYYKGGNMLHTMRHMIDDDKKWRSILRGLNKTFWHQTVTTQQVESYISEQSGIDFDKFFDQYLRTTKIPVVQYRVDGDKLTYRFKNVVPGFQYPVRLVIDGQSVQVTPTENEQTWVAQANIESVALDRNFYMKLSAEPVE